MEKSKKKVLARKPEGVFIVREVKRVGDRLVENQYVVNDFSSKSLR